MYVAILHKAAEYCNFVNSLSEKLCDRLVCGIMDMAVQKHLLAERDLTLAKAVSLAHSADIAEKEAKDLQTPTGNMTELY